MPPVSLRVIALATIPLLGGCIPEFWTGNDTGLEWSWAAPDNDWPMGEPPEGTVGEGFYEGQVIPDFRLVDQHGQEVALWQFYGRWIVLDISTMWCAPCRDLAADTEHTYQDYADEDLMYVTVLAQNVEGEDASIEDLGIWADAYGITAPILSDPGVAYSQPAVPQNQYPLVVVIDPELVVQRRIPPPHESNLRAALVELIGPP